MFAEMKEEFEKELSNNSVTDEELTAINNALDEEKKEPAPVKVQQSPNTKELITGDISFLSDGVINASVAGNITSSCNLVINADINGNIDCNKLTLSSKITGNITCKELILNKTASIAGSVQTGSLKIN